MNTETVQKNVALAPEEITQKDVTKSYLRWHFALTYSSNPPDKC